MHIKQMTVGMMGVCCYIAACDQTNEAVIIDPGGDEEDIVLYVDQSSSCNDAHKIICI